MKFWKRLRWISTLLFFALLVVSWLGIEPGKAGPAATQLPVPTIHR